MRIISKSVEETRALGRRIAGRLQPGDVLLLEGDLGAGKSELARGYAKIDHIAAALSDQDSRYESFSEHFVENLHRSVRCIILTGTGWRAARSCTSWVWTSIWAETAWPWWNGLSAARMRFPIAVCGFSCSPAGRMFAQSR